MSLTSDKFPPTRYSVVFAARSDDPTTRSVAMDAIAAAYWRPIYKYVRLKWNMSPDDAADFTQEFFVRLLEKEFLAAYDRTKGRLRTFLRVCVDRLYMNQLRDAHRIKRGAGNLLLSLDFEDAESELAIASGPQSPDDCFEKEWVRSLMALGVERLRTYCEERRKEGHFKLFERYDLGEDEDVKPSYASLAGEFRISVADVTNYLAFARREFRRCVLEQLRDMTTTDEEFRSEALALLGIEVQ